MYEEQQFSVLSSQRLLTGRITSSYLIISIYTRKQTLPTHYRHNISSLKSQDNRMPQKTQLYRALHCLFTRAQYCILPYPPMSVIFSKWSDFLWPFYTSLTRKTVMRKTSVCMYIYVYTRRFGWIDFSRSNFLQVFF